MGSDPGLVSKHVEWQMEEAERERSERASSAPAGLSPAEIERRESVRLSISRTRQQLARATHPRHRKMLRLALATLMDEL